MAGNSDARLAVRQYLHVRLLLLALCLASCTPVASSPTPPPSAESTVQTRTLLPPAPTSSPALPTGPQRSVVTFYRTEDVIRGSAQPAKRLDVAVPIYDLQFGPDPRWRSHPTSESAHGYVSLISRPV
jgi:hypothetical protein